MAATPSEQPPAWTKLEFDASLSGPLNGIKVVDLSRLVAGNMLSLQLADYGADVMKVEPLPTGDTLRAWSEDGVPVFWKTYARNKKSLALNFRAEGAMDLLRRLFAGADVVIESFRPGTLEKMGLDPKQLLADNPGLVLVRVSGFGQTGPYSARPGFGTVMEGMSGFASLNGFPDSPPLLPPLALADMVAGLYGAFATVTALRARDQATSGGGQIIDLSLLEPLASILGPVVGAYRVTGEIKPRAGNASNTTSPRNVYRARDGKYIAISGSTQPMATRIFETIGRPELNQDPRFCDNTARLENRDEVDRIIGDWIAGQDRAEALQAFAEAGVTAGPIYDAADVEFDPHFQARDSVVELPDADLGWLPMHNIVPRLSRTPGGFRLPAPDLGAHSREILDAAGWSEDEIERLLAAGVIVQAGS